MKGGLKTKDNALEEVGDWENHEAESF